MYFIPPLPDCLEQNETRQKNHDHHYHHRNHDPPHMKQARKKTQVSQV